MSASTRLLSDPTTLALGRALFHSVWQGALVAAALAVVRVALRRSSANAHYMAACSALALMVVLPIATYFVVRSHTFDTTAPNLAKTPFAISSVTSLVDGQAPPSASRLDTSAPWFVVAWLAGVAALSLRLASGLVVARRLRRAARAVGAEWQRTCDRVGRRVGVIQTVVLCESAAAGVPSVVGWIRPIVLMPVGVFVGLNARQIEAILAHELAHVRRADALVNLVQTAIETLMFYHPAVWWVSRVIREEREHCCDDLAVAACGDVLTYARALAELDDLRPAAGPLALAATGGSLVRRIRRLVGHEPSSVSSSSRHIAALALAVVFAVILATWLSSSPAFDVPIAEAADVSTNPSAQSNPRKRPVDAPAPATSRSRAEQDRESHVVASSLEGAEAPRSTVFEQVGYPSLSQKQLAAFDGQGVTPDTIRELAAAGYDRLTPETLTAIVGAGVDGAYVASLRAVGLAHPTVDQLLAMRGAGVTAAYVRELRDLGFSGLSCDELVAAAGNGVSAAYCRRIVALGVRVPKLSTLVAMCANGVSPDFARAVCDLGYSPTGDELVALRSNDVSTAFIRAVEARDGRVSIDRIVELHHGDPE